MSRRIIAAAVLLATSAGAHAADITNIQGLTTQADFRLLSDDLSSALSYKAVTPAKPLGLLGFDIGAEATATKLQNPGILQAATQSSSKPTYIVVPKLHLHKGLPLGFDIDGFYSAVPASNVKLVGGSLSYALLKGGVTEPAISLRGTYTKMTGVDELDFKTKGVELSISKGFALFTPYAGVGRIKTDSDPKGMAAAAGLTNESFSQNKYFLGANLNLGIVNLALEGDKTGDATSYSVKLGLRF